MQKSCALARANALRERAARLPADAVPTPFSRAIKISSKTPSKVRLQRERRDRVIVAEIGGSHKFTHTKKKKEQLQGQNRRVALITLSSPDRLRRACKTALPTVATERKIACTKHLVQAIIWQQCAKISLQEGKKVQDTPWTGSCRPHDSIPPHPYSPWHDQYLRVNASYER